MVGEPRIGTPDDATTPAGGTDEARLFTAILEAMTDPAALFARDGRRVLVNQAYRDSFGTTSAEVEGTACTATHHVGSSRVGSPQRCGVCEALDLGQPVRRVQSIPDVDGERHRFEATASPLAGVVSEAALLVVWRDLTEHRQLEVQIAHGERLASLGLLAAGVAHEINNPLASMLAAAEALQRRLEEGLPGAAALREMSDITHLLEKQVERCRDVTDKLRQLGRPYEQKSTRVDVNAAIRDTLQLLDYELRRHRIELAVDLATDLPPIWGREAGIRGVCMNVMLNAVQAMGGKGGRLEVKTCRNGESIVLTVADTGPGIPPEHIPRLWDPFFTTKPAGQGTGLGLSITHRVVTRHGGRIAVDSEPGVGASFRIDLPIDGPGGDE